MKLTPKGEKHGGTKAPRISIPRHGPVVIIDSNPSDGVACEGVVSELKPRFPVQILTTCADLKAYLRGDGLYGDRGRFPMPSFVLLDVEIQHGEGFALLEWMKAHPEFGDVPVVVMSGRNDMVAQVTRAYGIGACSFLPKPVQLRDMQSVVSLLNITI